MEKWLVRVFGESYAVFYLKICMFIVYIGIGTARQYSTSNIIIVFEEGGSAECCRDEKRTCDGGGGDFVTEIYPVVVVVVSTNRRRVARARVRKYDVGRRK